MSAGHRVVDNPDRNRFELFVGDHLTAWVDYRPAGASVIIAHTEVEEGHEGEGLGSEIVSAALDAVAAQGKTVIPTCPFTAAYIGRHPERVALVDPSLRSQFGG